MAASVAGALAFDNAVTNSQDCIQILGGIGFTFEHDAHFYMRRAGALRQAIGGAARWRRSLADLTLAGKRRHLDIDLSEIVGIDAKREEIKALVARSPPPRAMSASRRWPTPVCSCRTCPSRGAWAPRRPSSS